MREVTYADQPYKQAEIASATASPSAALALPFRTTNSTQRLVLEAQGDDIYFAFGGSSVAASKTVTSSFLPDGVFSVTNGHVVEIDLSSDKSQGYVSVQNKTAASATAIIRLCETAA